MEITQIAPLSVIIAGAGFGLLILYYTQRFFAQSSIKTKSFFLFYILFPFLVVSVLFRGFINIGEMSGTVDYILIAKYLGSYWVAISALFLLEKVFDGSSFFYCMMILLALAGLILTPQFAPQVLDQFMEILNEQLSAL